MLSGMQIFRYWARAGMDREGRPVEPGGGVTEATGWSDTSPAEAEAMARERAARFAQWLRESPGRPYHKYGYLDRPLREPILEEIMRDDARIAALTRTTYGAVVLNTARLFIADIDDRPVSPLRALRRLWNRLCGQPASEDERIRGDIEPLLAADRSLGIRLYRTAAGYRVIVTSRGIDAESEEAARLLQALGSDPLYIRLCEHQQCYRARLTPKPWRMKLAPPRAGAFPPRDDRVGAELAEWVAEYDRIRRNWSVCRLLGTYGSTRVDGELAPLLKLHDQWTIAHSRPLA